MLAGFVAGGLAGCCATICVQPIDAVKVNLQLPIGPGAPKPTAASVARSLWASGGVGAFYRGIGAGLGRQIIYGSARLGLFRAFSDALVARGPPGQPLSLASKVAAGAGAGLFGSFLGTPMDLVLVRLQTDRALPEAARRNYKGVVDAFLRIAREDGVRGLWKGGAPTVIRATILTSAQMSVSDEAKERLAPFSGKGTTATLLLSSIISGVAASAASLPADMIKTRMQSGSGPTKSFLATGAEVVSKEGVTALWRGLGTYTVRIAPHAIITLILLDVFTPLVKSALA